VSERERERDTKKEVVGFLFSAFASGARAALRAQIERERERGANVFLAMMILNRRANSTMNRKR